MRRRVAPVMADLPVDGAISGWIVRDQQNQPPARLEQGSHGSERRGVILKMFEHIEADHGIELPLERKKMFRVRCVERPDPHGRAVPEPVPEAVEILTFDIGCNVERPARAEMPAEIPRARSDFENPAAGVGGNRVRQPAIELRREGKRVENRMPRIVVKPAGEARPEDDPYGLERVAQTDLLAILISPAMVADGRFVNAGFAPRELDGQFGFDAETVALDGNRFHERGPE